MHTLHSRRSAAPGLLLISSCLAPSAAAQVAWSHAAIETNSSRAIAFDPVGSRLLMFSTSHWNPARGSQTSFWDGQHWTLLSPRTVPPGRRGHAVVTDTVRRRIVLFGGDNLDDTWEWDGADWTQRLPSTSPPPRG